MSDPRAAAKRRAALQAVDLVAPGMVLGLGTGSTVRYAIEEIGRRISRGELKDVVGVPTSRATKRLAEEAGIPLAGLNDYPEVDLTIDGADEVDPDRNLIKGHGGALLWEKIVASASRRLVIVVDRSKLVSRLGLTKALPVEVVAFGWRVNQLGLSKLGCDPVLRTGPGGSPFSTDEGHYILDCSFEGGIADPVALEREIKRRPGVVETGLFLGFEPQVIVGED
ncbi:MAG: ribose-5-phosphate isomerase A [Gemmatimonadales bacterium]|nr:MAG: ribose-5-phosphate isomerase A [Gemmatimonadales bacterium]